MNPKLADWASIAEIVSGVAVVVTLVFLILGIQENTEATRASTYGRSMAGMLDFRKTIITDPEVARVYNAFLDYNTAELDDVGTTRVRQLIWMVYSIYEDAFYAQEYGVLGGSEWTRFRQQICLHWPRMVSAGFDESLPEVMTPDFMYYIEDLVKNDC